MGRPHPPQRATERRITTVVVLGAVGAILLFAVAVPPEESSSARERDTVLGTQSAASTAAAWQSTTPTMRFEPEIDDDRTLRFRPTPRDGELPLIKEITVDKRRVCVGHSVLVTAELEAHEGEVETHINRQFGRTALVTPKVVGTQTTSVRAYGEQAKGEQSVVIRFEAVECPHKSRVFISRHPDSLSGGILLKAHGAPWDGSAFVWDYGDGSGSTTILPETHHKYAPNRARKYVVKVTSTDSNGREYSGRALLAPR